MSEIQVDTVSEKTAASGVTVDGVVVKDSGLTIPSGGTLTVASGGTINITGATQTGFGVALNTPDFLAATTSSSTWTTSYTIFTFANVISESDAGSYNTSTNRFTVPTGKGGTYMFAINFNVNTGIGWGVKTLKNSTTELWWSMDNYAPYGGTRVITGVCIAELAAADYIEWHKWGSTGFTGGADSVYGVRLHA
jgi:hypothetical protein|tara:strand:+ start:6133 stop:6714 length:582 start_codon:yes stop_codon:yes gene_type:complete